MTQLGGARGRLKPAAWHSDDTPMRDLACPVCCADLPLSGDEKAGDEVFCTYCNAPCRLTAAAGSEDCEVEEDY